MSLLRMKAWQLFMLIIGLSIVVFIVSMVFVISHVFLPGWFMILMAAVFLIGLFVFFRWIYVAGRYLPSKLPESLHMNTRRFRIQMTIPIVYFMLLIPLVNYFNIVGYKMSVSETLIWIAIHMFCVYCMFYGIYFIAKTLRMIELKRNVTFADYSNLFFLLWFFPIGIWVVQPRINDVFAEDNWQELKP